MECLRCSTEMMSHGTIKIQLGETTFLLRNLGNLVAGSLEVNAYECPSCGKIEFFSPRDQRRMPKSKLTVNCIHCGKSVDVGEKICPHCNKRT